MKKISILILCVLASACSHKVVPKPETLLSMEQMESIVYDISILQSAVLADRTYFADRAITPFSYIFKKHEIDSLTYAQNDLYYASRPREYAIIYKRAAERLKQLKEANEKESFEQ